MKTFLRRVVFVFIMSLLTLLSPIFKSTAQTTPPTRLARYQLGSYISADSTRLRVNINKQLGGQLYIHLMDQEGNLLFEETMAPMDTTRRLSLNLMELTVGNYTLKVSNGLEVAVRPFKIISRKPRKMPRPATLARTITLL